MPKTRRVDKYLDRATQLIFTLGLAIFYCFQSPLNPFEGADVTTDSGVFQYVAFLMGKGLMPYRDTFDHKGPLLYVINWLGQVISSYKGIWVIEVLFLTAAFWLFYKIARLFAGKLFSYAAVLLCSSLLVSYFDQGNFVEEYAMPFIAGALYIFFDYFLNKRISALRLFLCGASFGCVLLLRPNMIAVWFVFCIAVLVQEFCCKNGRVLAGYTAFFLAGTFTVILPFMIWLGANGALQDFYYDYIIFNKIYSSAEGASALWGARVRSASIFMNNFVCLLAGGVTLFWVWFKRRGFDTAYLLCLICSFVFVTISGRAYGHYGMVLIPLYIYPIASLEAILQLILKDEARKKIAAFFTATILLITMVFPNMLLSLYAITLKIDDREAQHRSEITLYINELIQQNTTEQDKITVYGNWDIIYTTSGRLSASKYSYQFPIGEVLTDIKNSYFEELRNNQPKLVVIEAGRMDVEMMNFLEHYQYELIWEEGNNGAAVYRSIAG